MTKNKLKFIGILAILIILGLTGLTLFRFIFAPTLEGIIGDLNLKERSLNIITNKDSRWLKLNENTKLLDSHNIPTTFSNFVKGFPIKIWGKEIENNYQIFKIKILKEPNIIVDEPIKNSNVSQKLVIRGRARVFENVVSLKLLDAKKNVVWQGTTLAQAPDIGLYGEFEKIIDIPSTLSQKLTLEVFQVSAKDGTEIDKVIIPLNCQLLNQSDQSLEIKIFLGNSQLDPEGDCQKVFPLKRKIPYTLEVARKALEELIKGPNEEETKLGYFTSLPTSGKIQIQKLVIKDGIAQVDFSKELEQGIGGSCRVSAIRAQIIKTLEQFPSVKKVIISIDDRTEDILQP